MTWSASQMKNEKMQNKISKKWNTDCVLKNQEYFQGDNTLILKARMTVWQSALLWLALKRFCHWHTYKWLSLSYGYGGFIRILGVEVWGGKHTWTDTLELWPVMCPECTIVTNNVLNVFTRSWACRLKKTSVWKIFIC